MYNNIFCRISFSQEIICRYLYSGIKIWSYWLYPGWKNALFDQPSPEQYDLRNLLI